MFSYFHHHYPLNRCPPSRIMRVCTDFREKCFGPKEIETMDAGPANRRKKNRSRSSKRFGPNLSVNSSHSHRFQIPIKFFPSRPVTNKRTGRSKTCYNEEYLRSLTSGSWAVGSSTCQEDSGFRNLVGFLGGQSFPGQHELRLQDGESPRTFC